MEQDDKTDTDMSNLERIMDSLYHQYPSGDTLILSRIFQFFHNILLFENMPFWLDTLLWVMTFVMVDIIIFFATLPLDWFAALSHTYNKIDFNSYANSGYSQILIQQLSIILCFFSIGMFIYMLVSYFTLKPQKIMTSKRASFLIFYFLHYPHLMCPVYGLFIGGNMLSYTRIKETTVLNSVSIVLAVIFAVLLGVNTLFYFFTRYSLTMRKGYFTYWSPPIRPVDQIMFFVIGLYAPFRSSFGYRKYLTAIYIFLILWGVYYFAYLYRQPSFISILSLVCQYTIPIDSILFGVYGIILLWTDSDLRVSTTIFYILKFISMTISCFVAFNPLLIIPHEATVVNQDEFTSKISQLNSIAALRNSLTYSLSNVANIEHIKKMIATSKNPAIIPDIVRFCDIVGYKLCDVKVQMISFSPADIFALKFLAYQHYVYKQSLLTDDHQIVKDLCHEIEELVEKQSQIFVNFWTTNDFDHLSLHGLGKMLTETSLRIANACYLCPHSIRLKELWYKFEAEIMASPTKSDVLNFETPFYRLENPCHTIYGFIKHSETDLKVSTKSVPNLIEYFTQHDIKSLYSRLYFFRLLTAFYCIILVVYNFDFAIRSNKHWNYYQSLAQLEVLSIGISTKLLPYIEKDISIPPAANIAINISISIEEASDLRNPVTYNSDLLDNAKQAVSQFSSEWYPKVAYKNCKNWSLIYLVKMKIANLDLQQCACMFAWIYAYSKQISSYANHTIHKAIAPLHNIVPDQLNIVISISCVFFLIYIIILVFWKIKVAHMRLFILQILNQKEDFCAHGEPCVYFSYTLQLFIFFFLMISAFVMFYIYSVALDDSIDFLNTLSKQMVYSSDLIRSIFSLYTLTSLWIASNKKFTEFKPYFKTFSYDIIKNAHKITTIAGYEHYMNAWPLNIWLENSSYPFSSIVMDFAHNLEDTEINVESIRYLQARFAFHKNFTKFLNVTIPELINFNRITKHEFSVAFWPLIISIVCIISLGYLLNEIFSENQEYWYQGCCAITRSDLMNDSSSAHIRYDNYIHRKHKLLENINIPVMICTNDDTIIFANSSTIALTHHSIQQTIGQKINEFFKDNKSRFGGQYLHIISKPFSDDLSLLIFQDVSQTIENQDKYDKLLNQMMDPLFNETKREKIIYINIRFQFAPELKSEVFDCFDEFENKHIHRISCGLTFYTATCDYNKPDEAIKLAVQFMNKFSNIIEICINEGINTCISRETNGSLIVVLGKSIKRSEEIIRNGVWGRLYLETTYIQRLSPNILNKLVDESNTTLVELSYLGMNELQNQKPKILQEESHSQQEESEYYSTTSTRSSSSTTEQESEEEEQSQETDFSVSDITHSS